MTTTLYYVITRNNRARIIGADFLKKHGGTLGRLQTHSITLKNDRYEFPRDPAPFSELKPLVEKYNAAAAVYFGSKDYKARVKAYRDSLKEQAA
jgi:hypothetical protein